MSTINHSMWKKAFLWVFLLVILLLGCTFELQWPSPSPATPVSGKEMRVVVFDIGQGDSILIISPNGKTMLVDGGNSSRDAEMVILPYFEAQGIDTLDVMVLTHPDADHVGGLPTVLRRMPVEIVVATGQVHTTQIYTEFLQELQTARNERGTEVLRGVRGLDIPFDPEVRLEVLGPSEGAIEESDKNNASIVLRLTYGSIRVLLTGDAEEEEEAWIRQQGSDLRAEVLKVSHHGSDTASSEAFLDAVDPEIGLISCSADNQYGHPHKKVLQRLIARDIEIYRTDRQGSITVGSDGSTYWVETGP